MLFVGYALFVAGLGFYITALFFMGTDTGQDLFYDSIVLTDLPPHGPFQLLEMDGPTGLQTEFGPGDPGYVGGRWWVDVNGDGEMDDGDDYFLCPLLGPGREDP